MTSRPPTTSRRLTIAAVVVLAFDGAALLVAGALSGSVTLLVTGALLAVASGLVVLYWRWHQRQLAEIAEARRALRDEAQALRDVLSGG